MSYTVLARRYRSKDFDDLIGQEPIAQTLKNAIESNRVAHAYLFCGTRGVGKTSTARILAKALNCEKGPTPKPCNQCDRCRAISAGEDLDVIEIDGASNRGIDEIRNLRNNAIYRPARAPYKIYIIDEVHMLTKEAFNALLKTLEEPPEHVKFIFATTESQKVPQTILSRCQEFSFRLIPTAEIAEHLTEILRNENIHADPAVIQRVARAGRGSMRDALSLMDQLLAMGAEKITEPMVDYLLGEPANEQMTALVAALAESRPADALVRTDQLLSGGYAPEQFVVSMIEHLRRLMLLGIVGPDCQFVDLGSAERQQLAEQARRFDPTSLVYMVQLLEQLRQSVRSSTTAARALIDAAIVRLALLEQFADTAELVERLEGGPAAAAGAGGDSKKKVHTPLAVSSGGSAPGAAQASGSPGGPRTGGSTSPGGARTGGSTSPGAGGGEASADGADGDDRLGPPIVPADVPLEQAVAQHGPAGLWGQILARLREARMSTLSGPLAMASLASIAGQTVTLAVKNDLLKLLSASQRQQQLEAALGRLLAREIKVNWVGQSQAASTAGRPAGGSPGPGGRSSDGGSPQQSAGESPAPAAVATQRLSQREIDQISGNETIRQVMDIFNADLVAVERRGDRE